MTAELRDVLVLLPTRERLRLAVGVSVEGSRAWGQQGPGVSVEGSRRGSAWGQHGFDLHLWLPHTLEKWTLAPAPFMGHVSLLLCGPRLWLRLNTAWSPCQAMSWGLGLPSPPAAPHILPSPPAPLASLS